MFNKMRLEVGAFAIMASVTYLALQGSHNFSNYFVTVRAFRADPARFHHQTLRVQGTIAPASVRYNHHTATLSFDLTQGRAQLPVVYRGAMPNERFHNVQAIVKGHMGPAGTFKADKLEIQCPDHYAPAQGVQS